MSGSKFTGKQNDSISDVLRKLHQSWDDKLVIPVSKLPERYLRGDLTICLHCICKVDGNGLKFSCFVKSYNVREARREIQVECSEHHNQLPVLVDSVQVIDDPQRVIKRVRSVVKTFGNKMCLSL